MAKHYDNVYSFYFNSGPDSNSSLVENIVCGAIFPTGALAYLATEALCGDIDADGADLVFGLLCIAMFPLSIPTFCIALIVALPLVLAAPFAFFGAMIADKIEEIADCPSMG